LHEVYALVILNESYGLYAGNVQASSGDEFQNQRFESTPPDGKGEA